MTTKIWDVVPARTKDERYYAHMEYMRIVWANLWEATTYIEVSYE